MANVLKVILWGEEIGRLAWDSRRRTSYFTFNPEFIQKGMDISPLTASVKNNRGQVLIWGETGRLYQKLPAFLADSLPDAWGNQLFELWRAQNHIPNSEITPLEKLSFIGKRGMGALEFEPEVKHLPKGEKMDVKSLAELAEKIIAERENTCILPEESLTMQSLLAVGTSAGGRQPKAIVAINRKTGEIRSGQVAGREDFDYCLLKFGDAQHCSAELEMTYYEMAIKAGIQMMLSELITIEGKRHFLTRRFDRDGNRKLHTQTLAAIYPEADSYEQLVQVCRKLHLPEMDCEEVFRRMVFNHLANNSDDHNKNFSFIMNERGQWRLAPAYDMTYIIDAGGYLPYRDHCLFVRTKLYGVTMQDALDFAKANGIRRPDGIIRSVAKALEQFHELASKNGVTEEWIGRVEASLSRHLSEWGLKEHPAKVPDYTDSEGFCIENARLEQALKGNIHLYASINGKEYKYIIRKDSEEYIFISHEGIINIATDYLKDLISKFLIPKAKASYFISP